MARLYRKVELTEGQEVQFVGVYVAELRKALDLARHGKPFRVVDEDAEYKDKQGEP